MILNSNIKNFLLVNIVNLITSGRFNFIKSTNDSRIDFQSNMIIIKSFIANL